MMMPCRRFIQFADPRMIDIPGPILPVQFRFLGMFALYLNLSGLVKPQRQFITADLDLHRVSHRCNLLQGHFRTWRQPHIQQMMPQRSAAVNGGNERALFRFQFV